MPVVHGLAARRIFSTILKPYSQRDTGTELQERRVLLWRWPCKAEPGPRVTADHAVSRRGADLDRIAQRGGAGSALLRVDLGTPAEKVPGE